MSNFSFDDLLGPFQHSGRELEDDELPDKEPVVNIAGGPIRYRDPSPARSSSMGMKTAVTTRAAIATGSGFQKLSTSCFGLRIRDR